MGTFSATVQQSLLHKQLSLKMSASATFAGLLLTPRQTRQMLKEVSFDAVLSVSKVDTAFGKIESTFWQQDRQHCCSGLRV